MQATVGICEDDHDLRGALVRALESEGYRTRTAATGHAAMASFGSGGVDALILDIGLPDADGRDVCRALRAHGVQAPVLFLTGSRRPRGPAVGIRRGRRRLHDQAVRAGGAARAAPRAPAPGRPEPSNLPERASASTPPRTRFGSATGWSG
jgi:CheY-like chemotaxis protein